MPRNLPREPIILNSVRAVSQFFQVNERTAGRWFDQGCPYVKKGPKNCEYDLFLIHQWLVEYYHSERVRSQRKTGGEPSKDLKKRLDEIKIRKEDLIFAERIGAVLPRDHCDIAFGAIEEQIRKAGELLLKHHGEDAQEILTEALDEAKRVLAKLFADDHKSKVV